MEIEQLYKIFEDSDGICTDTRKMEGRQLFFALRGENFNGNTFVEKALSGGCIAAVADDPSVNSVDGIILVDDALSTLQALATFHRKQLNTEIIALTGSNGKTSSKELLRDVMAKKFNTYATKGNLNNHFGVPLSLLELKKDHEFAIIEMGANAIGEIAHLAQIAQPDYGFITNIGKAHLEGFGGLAGVKKGKRELFDHLKAHDKIAFVNAADPTLLEISEGMRRELYGTDVHSPEVYLIEQSPTLRFWWSHQEYFSGEISTHLTGEYNLKNIVTAIAIGRYFGVGHEDVSSAISSYKPTNNRSQLFQGERNTLILDAYNANPSSMQEALQSFASRAGEEKICILGDMFELGEDSQKEHRNIVEFADRLGLSCYLVGQKFSAVASSNQATFPDTDALSKHLKSHPLEGKTVLLKGSRAMKLEELIPLF